MKTFLCILIGVGTGIGASYLLVVKGLKIPAGILGISGLVVLYAIGRANNRNSTDFMEWLVFWGGDGK